MFTAEVRSWLHDPDPKTFPYDAVVRHFHSVGKHFVPPELIKALAEVRELLPTLRGPWAHVRTLADFLATALDKPDQRYDYPTFLAQFQIDHAGAVPTMAVRERHDAVTQAWIRIRPRHIPQGSGAHVYDGQGAPLADPTCDHLPHHLASSRCGHHFFRSTSRVTSFSSRESASNFLRRRFSISSSFSRFASETLMPPNLLRQR